MRQRRAKLYRKMLQQFSLQFGFREPFQLLIDDTFALALTRYKIENPLSQFSNVLQTKKIKPLITQCCMQALYLLGKEHRPTVTIAKEWERRLCNHREAIDPQECVKQCVGAENKHRYVVASEKGELRRDLRLNVVGVPMMHFTQSVMVLEPMSELTKSKIEEKEDVKLSLPASEAGLLKHQPAVEVDIVGAEEKEEEDTKEGSSTRRRKRKAPNPLSVRKAKNPKLTMEAKLEKEQEAKKHKQRLAARARLEANKLKDGSASGDGEKRRKRKRSSGNKVDAETAERGNKETQNKIKPAPTSATSKSESTTRRRRRSRSSSANAAAESSA